MFDRNAPVTKQHARSPSAAIDPVPYGGEAISAPPQAGQAVAKCSRRYFLCRKRPTNRRSSGSKS